MMLICTMLIVVNEPSGWDVEKEIQATGTLIREAKTYYIGNFLDYFETRGYKLKDADPVLLMIEKDKCVKVKK